MKQTKFVRIMSIVLAICLLASVMAGIFIVWPPLMLILIVAAIIVFYLIRRRNKWRVK